MPSEFGLIFAQKLKALEGHTRIVILTVYASVAMAVEAINRFKLDGSQARHITRISELMRFSLLILNRA